MKENVRIVQIRASVFLSENIGFEPSAAEKFKELLMPQGSLCAVMPGAGGQVVLTPSNAIPWGATWGIMNDQRSMRIIFLPGKIDFIKDYDCLYDCHLASDFLLSLVVNSLKSLEDVLKPRDVVWQRIAYAPLMAMIEGECGDALKCLWNNIMHVQEQGGGVLEERSVTFLQKKVVNWNDRATQINLHHNIMDGVRFFKDGRPEQKATLIQLDINTVPGMGLFYSMDEIKVFYQQVIPLAEELVERITNC